MKNNSLKLECTVLGIKEPTFFSVRDKVFHRQIITVVTFDKQKMFLELRDSDIKKLKVMKIDVGDSAIFEIFFAGSEKKDKFYNNIVVKNIMYSWEDK